MRILLVGDHPNDPRLGSAKVPHKLREEYVGLGHTCDLLFAEDLGPWPRHRVARWALAPWLAARAVSQAFRANGPYDVVDIAGGDGAVFGAFRRAGRFAGTTFVSRSNGLEHRNYQRMLDDHETGVSRKPWYRRLPYPATRLIQVALSARLSDRLLLLNEGDRAYVVARGWKPADRIEIVSHGLASDFLNPESHDEARGGGALFCGSWSDVKGTRYLSAAWSHLVAKGHQLSLTVLGGGVPADVITAAFDPEVRPLVQVIERVSEDEVREQYRRHDLLVFPSTYEGFGMVVPEAMSQRLPVVATPVGCVPSLIEDEVSGLIVPARNPQAMAAAVRRLDTDRALRTRLGDRARERVRGMSWSRTAHQTLALYGRAGARTAVEPEARPLGNHAASTRRPQR